MSPILIVPLNITVPENCCVGNALSVGSEPEALGGNHLGDVMARVIPSLQFADGKLACKDKQ